MKISVTAFIMSVFLSVFILIGFVACETKSYKAKDDNPVTAKERQNKIAGTFKGRLITSFCAYHIVQILDSAFYMYAMDWTDSEGRSYQHVFTVKNHCDFGKANVKVNDTFDCAIVHNAIDINCSFCEGFMETPPLQYNILVGE